MTDAEIEELREAMDSQQDEIRAALEEEGVDVGEWGSSTDGAAAPDAERDTADSD